MITKGMQVFIRPEYQDEGDADYIWLAVEDQDGGRVKIQAQTGATFQPVQVVTVSMLGDIN